jgi:hypothetical protein
MNSKPIPPKPLEIILVILGSIACIAILTKMVRDLDKRKSPTIEQIQQ